MRFLGVAVILAIASVLLVSSDVARIGRLPLGARQPPVGHAIGPANAGPAPPADAKPVVSRSGPEVQQSVDENRDKRVALGFLLLLQMFGGRRG
jgi:hypothetical protein